MERTEKFKSFTEELMSFSSLGIRPGLGRVSRLLTALGSPEKKFTAVQVLGTNGKGSTSAVIESIFRASGLKTAMYTSPHLVSLAERLRLNGEELSIEKWRSVFNDVAKAVKSNEFLSSNVPTFFENLTAICFLMISRGDVDIAVLEAGMGGRYDATSSCVPAATVITPIGMDHMEYLGNELGQIASEKFAAIRESVPAFFAGDDEALTSRFFEECKNKGAKGYALDSLADVGGVSCDLCGTSFSYRSGGYEKRLRTRLIGLHQAKNAARAVTFVRTARELIPLFANITDSGIERGLASAVWPGRFEVLPGWRGKAALVLDGAHNGHGAAALVKTLESMIAGKAVSGVSSVVYASMKDKDITPILTSLKDLDCPVYCTTLREERAMPEDELALAAKRLGLDVKGVFADPFEALDEAGRLSLPGKITLCCGSLYLIGLIKSRLTEPNV